MKILPKFVKKIINDSQIRKTEARYLNNLKQLLTTHKDDDIISQIQNTEERLKEFFLESISENDLILDIITIPEKIRIEDNKKNKEKLKQVLILLINKQNKKYLYFEKEINNLARIKEKYFFKNKEHDITKEFQKIYDSHKKNIDKIEKEFSIYNFKA